MTHFYLKIFKLQAEILQTLKFHGGLQSKPEDRTIRIDWEILANRLMRHGLQNLVQRHESWRGHFMSSKQATAWNSTVVNNGTAMRSAVFRTSTTLQNPKYSKTISYHHIMSSEFQPCPFRLCLLQQVLECLCWRVTAKAPLPRPCRPFEQKYRCWKHLPGDPALSSMAASARSQKKTI